jgi:hypothetical protein
MNVLVLLLQWTCRQVLPLQENSFLRSGKYEFDHCRRSHIFCGDFFLNSSARNPRIKLNKDRGWPRSSQSPAQEPRDCVTYLGWNLWPALAGGTKKVAARLACSRPHWPPQTWRLVITVEGRSCTGTMCFQRKEGSQTSSSMQLPGYVAPPLPACRSSLNPSPSLSVSAAAPSAGASPGRSRLDDDFP